MSRLNRRITKSGKPDGRSTTLFKASGRQPLQAKLLRKGAHPREDNPHRPGPKYKPIDWTVVARLAQRGSTVKETAYVVGVHPDTLMRNPQFAQIYKKAFCEGNASLRRRQYRTAMNGSIPMNIWLGKNRLGQRNEVTSEDDSQNTLEMNVHHQYDIRNLSDNELEAWCFLLKKAAGLADPNVTVELAPGAYREVNGDAR